MTTRGTGRWPAPHQSTLLVTVDFEGLEYLAAHGVDGDQRDKSRSVFEYGVRRGVDAVLDQLAASGVTATWFVPGRVGQTMPASLRGIHEAGHEIGISGWALERLDALATDERADMLARARDTVASVTGTSPTGFRLPSGDWPVGLTDTLVELGFTWSSSLGGDDLPYRLPATAGQLVEVPRMPVMNDRVAFFWNYAPAFPPGQARIASYDGTLANWCHERRAAAHEGLCTVLELHPEVIGTPARRQLLAEFLADAAGDETWCPAGRDLATWWRNHLQQPSEPTHPLAVYLHGRGRQSL